MAGETACPVGLPVPLSVSCWKAGDKIAGATFFGMYVNNVKSALQAGKLQLGMNFGQLRSAEIPRLLAAAGFHWAFIDTEHGGFDLETVQDVCRVAQSAGLCPVVRVVDLQYGLVARALDSGAGGIIFPRMEDPKLLETALRWTKFPPEGVRGYGLQPSQTAYSGLSFNEVIGHANANTLTVVQIESKRAVEARDELLSVPGIDAVMIGPADLSISLGVPGDFQNPKMVEAMESVRDACERHGVAPGTHTRNAGLARFWKARGMRFLGCGSDIAFLWEKASETAKAVLDE
jgi:2-dehydro-3-deoxyglucarate aldolase/4-hydroxy-2-oxoheptanedioate aldolase